MLNRYIALPKESMARVTAARGVLKSRLRGAARWSSVARYLLIHSCSLWT